MRIRINFTGTEQKVPFSIQPNINGFIHQCLGKGNKFHDSQSNYCVSTIQGGKMNGDGKTLNMRNGCYIIVTSEDLSFLSPLLKYLNENQGIDFCHGMKFKNIDFITTDEFKDGWNHIGFASPFIIKTSKNREDKLYTFKDEGFEDLVKEKIIKKLSCYDPKLDTSNLKVEVMESDKNKIKKIDMKKPVNNKRIFSISNDCNISIFAKKNVMDVLYNIGIGSSTGAGFGTFFSLHNFKEYSK